MLKLGSSALDILPSTILVHCDRNVGRAISDDRYQRVRKDSDDRGWFCDDRSIEVIGAIGEGIGLTCGGERGDRVESSLVLLLR